MKLTIDASVWVSAFIAGDLHHAQADQVLETCLALSAKVLVPEIVLLEVAAGVSRVLQQAGPGQVAAKRVERFPGIKFVPLQAILLNKAITAATRSLLRAADALYVTTARESKATLITLDAEMLQRGVAAATVLTPAKWLESLPVKG